ncbi:MAG: hypothetical protein PHP82_04280, partial [Candidatus ainarchaeum sp.]|nr:hypothetical protein [Candidatus ainarchaeum sp.]
MDHITISKKDPIVRDFLLEYGFSEPKIVLFNANEIEDIKEEIIQNCGFQIPLNDSYKITFTDSNAGKAVTAWVDKTNNNVVCSYLETLNLGVKIACFNGILNNDTNKCESEPIIDYYCNIGNYDYISKKCLILPDSNQLCEQGEYDPNTKKCIFNPEIQINCEQGNYDSQIQKCIFNPQVQIICSKGIYNPTNNTCEYNPPITNICTIGQYDEITKTCIYKPTNLTCSEQEGIICLDNQTCSGEWLNASDTQYCCSKNCTNKTNNSGIVYVTWFSHNEKEGYWDSLIKDEQKYVLYREDLVEKIKLLHSYGIKLNWETDYIVVQAMQKWETGELLDNTNGKNILKWMSEDMDVIIDPHRHPSNYSYADIAYEIKKAGIEPSGILGGFRIYECADPNIPMSFSQVDYMEESSINFDGTINGNVYDYTWKVDILVQPANNGHTFDSWTTGVWRPDVNGDFFEHDPNGKFITIGQGYSHTKTLIGGTNSGGTKILYDGAEYVIELLSKIDSGELPSEKIYTTSVHFRDTMIETTYEDIEKVLKEYEPLVESGKVIYADYDSVAKIWSEKYNEEPNLVSIKEFSIYDNIVEENEKIWDKICMNSNGQNNTNKCGDGICDNIEKQMGTCPQDCEGETPSPQGYCGDGICDDIEKQMETCPQDCNTTQTNNSTQECIETCIQSGKNPQQCLQQCLCGDEICDDMEKQTGSCPQDC